MNGSENWYASAIFFALISFGTFLEFDDVIGVAGGAANAILAAISLRRALAKSAQAAEEDHQRMEIQLQQLRSKIMETSTASIEAMNAMNDAAHLLQENLQTIRVRLAELDNLTSLAKSTEEIQTQLTLLSNLTLLAKSTEEIQMQLAELNNLTPLAKSAEEINARLAEPENLMRLVKDIEAINTAVASLEENSFAHNAELEKIVVALQSQESTPSGLVDELKALNTTSKASEVGLQTILKLLQVIGQMMKTPAYSKDLDTLKAATDATHKELAELVKINGELSKNFTATMDELTRLPNRRETTRKTPQIEEPQPVLNEHDITMLKKIVAKINLK